MARGHLAKSSEVLGIICRSEVSKTCVSTAHLRLAGVSRWYLPVLAMPAKASERAGCCCCCRCRCCRENWFCGCQKESADVEIDEERDQGGVAKRDDESRDSLFVVRGERRGRREKLGMSTGKERGDRLSRSSGCGWAVNWIGTRKRWSEV